MCKATCSSFEGSKLYRITAYLDGEMVRIPSFDPQNKSLIFFSIQMKKIN